MPLEAYNRTPLLILSDAPSASSGLGRITRDLAMRIHAHVPEIEVACVGYGGFGSSKFGFKEYHLSSVENWLPLELPMIWNDFTQGREGVWMSIWDLSRFWWMTHKGIPAHLRQWLETAKMKKWLYHPVDAEGPNGKLSLRLQETMKAFDRVLDYSAFSCRVTGNTEHLPHGIDTGVFRPHSRVEAKRKFREMGFAQLKDDSFLVGIVATNQVRKDWALGIETCRILLDRGLDMKLWAHIDTLERHWNIPNLIQDFGLQDRVVITTAVFPDEMMAQLYSACDVTLGIGSEGYGFPIFESMACGVPCITGDYAGAAEHIPSGYKTTPLAYRYEGIYSCKRPIFDPIDWADACCRVESMNDPVQLPSSLDWQNLWPRWEKWLREGLQ